MKERIHLPKITPLNQTVTERLRKAVFDAALAVCARYVGQKPSELTVIHKDDLQYYRDVSFGLQLDHQDPMKYVRKVEEFDV